MTSRNQKINPTTEQAFGQGAALGIKPEPAREDHTHGTPGNPTDTHTALADPHIQYQMEDVRLTALSGLNTTPGLVEQTGSYSFGKRPIGVATATDIPTRGDADSRFAPIAKGVTNGDSHDHAGGDGGQVDHGGLGGLADDDHPQYQLDAEKNGASGYAGLNASSRITKGVDTVDDVIIDMATKGLILKDTQGTPHYWRITVTIAGALTISDIGTVKP